MGEEDPLTESQDLANTKPPRTAGGSLASPTGGGGNHVSTVRSLGLMHDLQEYIVAVEAVSNKRKAEIDRLKVEKRELEKLLTLRKSQERKAGGLANKTPTQFGPKEGFGDISNQDIPPKIRGIIEDNRMLKAELRTTREKGRMHERTIASQQISLNKLQEEVEQLTAQLKECSRQPEAIKSEAEMQETISKQDGQIKDLENRLAVLNHKLETDAKRSRDDLRTKEKLLVEQKKKTEEKAEQLEAKDKELRAKVLEWKGATKKMDAARRQLAESRKETAMLQDHLQTIREEQFGENMLHTMEDKATRVHVMLAVIYGDTANPGNQAQFSLEDLRDESAAEEANALPEMDSDEAATKVQSVYRGHLVRKGMAEKKASTEEAAAIKIQAQARGHLARKELDNIDSADPANEAELEQAAVKIQAGIRGHMARKEVQSKRLAAQAESDAAAAPDKAPETSSVASTTKAPAQGAGSPGKGKDGKGKGASPSKGPRPTNAANSSKVKK